MRTICFIRTILCLPFVKGIPLCVNCRFFKSDPFSNKYGKCIKFPKNDGTPYFLVNGKAETKSQNYHYCATARSMEHMCNLEGTLFEPKS